jgi:hypothetical protein
MGVQRALIVALALLAGWTAESQAALRANVRYEKSGGFAGISERLTVRPDGSGVAVNDDGRRAFRLAASRTRTLERAVRAADLAHTKDPKPGDGADAFQYSVAYALYELLEELYDRYAP